MVPRSRSAAVLAVCVSLATVLGILVSPASPVSAAASLGLSRSSVAQGDTETVQGYGFSAQDSVLVSANLRVNGNTFQVQSTAFTDGGGNFRTDVKIPNGTNQGVFAMEARDFHGHLATKAFTVLPLVYVRAGGAPGTTFVIPQHGFYVSGAGFQSGEYVRIAATFPLFDGNSVIVTKTVQAEANGTFYEASLHAPADAKPITLTLLATGQTSHRSGKGYLRTVYRPSLSDPGTVRPGTPVNVSGHEFVPGSTVQVSVTIPRNGATTETLSRNTTADGNGNFNTSIDLPTNVRLGRYTVSAFDTVGSFRATTSVLVSVHPTVKVDPTSLLPGEAFTVSGDNFGSGAHVTVSAVFSVRGGGNHTVSGGADTGSRGNYSVRLIVPNNVVSGLATVTARASNGQASTRVRIRPRPTPAPKPTPRPTNAPTSTPTPVPTATATATPPKHHRFAVRYISIWYHAVRIGTYDHVVLQSTLKTIQGVWVHVYFPAGQRVDFYTNTDRKGHWESSFNVPTNALPNNAQTGQAVITFRLWHGSASRRSYGTFDLVR